MRLILLLVFILFLLVAVSLYVSSLVAVEALHVCEGIERLLCLRGFLGISWAVFYVFPLGLVDVNCLFTPRCFSVEPLASGIILQFCQECICATFTTRGEESVTLRLYELRQITPQAANIILCSAEYVVHRKLPLPCPRMTSELRMRAMIGTRCLTRLNTFYLPPSK